MPLSKESRQRLLDAKLFNGELVNFQLFNEYLEENYEESIIKRTFERDIKSLKSMLADKHDDDSNKLLLYNRNTDSYYYEKNHFAFPETALVNGADLGKVLKYSRNFVTDMETEFNKQIDAIIHDYNEDENSKINWHPVVYQNKINEGQHNFTRVLNYIVQLTPVEIKHQPHGKEVGEPKNYILLLLKELDNNFAKGWYVLAQRIEPGQTEIELDVNQFRIMALDRIVGMRAISKKININYKPDFNPADYFKDALKGLVRNNLNKNFKGAEPVTLKLTQNDSWIYQYLKIYKIHPSQKIRIEKDATYIDLMIEIDLDLENFVFLYSKELVVISPASFKKTIHERIKTVLNNYKS